MLDTAGWLAYVGHVDGEPVTTTQLIVDGDVAGLYYVGTMESARGRGYGEAITRHAMGEAASLGCSRTTLQASPMGLPIDLRAFGVQAGDLLPHVRPLQDLTVVSPKALRRLPAEALPARDHHGRIVQVQFHAVAHPSALPAPPRDAARVGAKLVAALRRRCR